MQPEHDNPLELTAAYKIPQLLFNNLKMEGNTELAKRIHFRKIINIEALFRVGYLSKVPAK